MIDQNMKQKELKYVKLMEDLKEKILSGEIQTGDKLPSENELSSQYQISRQTVRKALSILENAGYVYAEHGRGTFCCEPVHHSRKSKNIAVVTTYLSDYISQGHTGHRHHIDKRRLQHHIKKYKKFQKSGSKMSGRTFAEGYRRYYYRAK